MSKYPDWSHVVAGYEDGSVKILDIATSKELLSIVAEQDDQDMVAVGFDRYIATTPDKTWVIWDVHEGALVELAKLTKEILMPYFSKNSLNEEKIVMMGNNATSSDHNYHAKIFNGTIKLFDSRTGKEIAQFITFKDGEWIVITPEGYYNGSPNGAKHINVRIGNNVYGIENYSENLFRPDLVKAALANVRAGKDEDGWAGLMGAVKDGDTETVKALLAKGADANAKNNDSETVLMLAAEKGYTETVEVLLAKGADINAKDKYGKTVLMLAESAGRTEIARILKQAGARE
jgi:hypothetical protein